MEWFPATMVAESFSSCSSALTPNYTLKLFVELIHYAKQAGFFS